MPTSMNGLTGKWTDRSGCGVDDGAGTKPVLLPDAVAAAGGSSPGVDRARGHAAIRVGPAWPPFNSWRRYLLHCYWLCQRSGNSADPTTPEFATIGFQHSVED